VPLADTEEAYDLFAAADTHALKVVLQAVPAGRRDEALVGAAISTNHHRSATP
jgi:hypothetical protein